MGFDLRDSPGADDRREHGQSQRRIERERHYEQLLRLGRSDSPGYGEHRVFDCHSLHSVYCQSNRAGRSGQHHAGHGGDGGGCNEVGREEARFRRVRRLNTYAGSGSDLSKKASE